MPYPKNSSVVTAEHVKHAVFTAVHKNAPTRSDDSQKSVGTRVSAPVRSDNMRRNPVGARLAEPIRSDNIGRNAVSAGRLRQSLHKAVRQQTGSIMPFLAMCVMLMMGTVGIAVELTRMFETVSELKFAAKAAALYGLSQATDSSGNYSIANAQNNILAAVMTAGNNGWNMAECGPQGSFFTGSSSANTLIWRKPVSFEQTDIQFVSNPLDLNEFFVQLIARRQGNDALQQIFLPLLWLYTTPLGTRLPAQLNSAGTFQTTEVLGQPASRIGPGSPLNSAIGSAASNFIGWAALPLAISNLQFAAAADPSQTTTTIYTVDIVSPQTASSPVLPGHIKACLVNVAATGSGSSYYGPGTGASAVNDLIGLLNYFNGQQPSTLPAMVERGSMLNAFDLTNPAFTAGQANNTITQLLQALPNKFYIVPVLAGNPSFAGTNTVAGFARLYKSGGANTTGGVVSSLTMDLGESVPLRNASAAGGSSAIPGNSGNLMPQPAFPFLPRTYDPGSNGVSIRPQAVVFAPALSPRPI